MIKVRMYLKIDETITRLTTKRRHFKICTRRSIENFEVHYLLMKKTLPGFIKDDSVRNTVRQIALVSSPLDYSLQ